MKQAIVRLLLQTLAIAKEPGHVSRKQHQIDRQLDFPAVPVYRNCSAAWYAAIWWQVSESGHGDRYLALTNFEVRHPHILVL